MLVNTPNIGTWRLGGVAGVTLVLLGFGGLSMSYAVSQSQIKVSPRTITSQPGLAFQGQPQFLLQCKIISQAELAIKQRRYQDSESYARRLLALNREDLEGWYYLAVALDGQEREKESYAAYTELLRPDSRGVSSWQKAPDVLMRYAYLCLRNGDKQKAEKFARQAMAASDLWSEVVGKLPSLPMFSFQPSDVRQVEAMSQLLSGVGDVKNGRLQAGLDKLDGAIKDTDNDAIKAVGYWTKYQTYSSLAVKQPEKASFYRGLAQATLPKVAFHDRNLGFYKEYVAVLVTPAELKAIYQNTPSTTFNVGTDHRPLFNRLLSQH